LGVSETGCKYEKKIAALEVYKIPTNDEKIYTFV